ncbi:MAG: PQQ-binding-like beta-propeller repeat protein, partial [Bacteroidota bacterium]
MNYINYLKFVFILLFILFCCFPSYNQVSKNPSEWPRFRGKFNSGIWHTDLNIDTLTPANIKKLWEADLKPGYSGPTVSDQKVFVMDYDRESSKERVLCFDESTGEKNWEYEYPVDYAIVGYPVGPRASVIIENDQAFSFGTMGHLHCFDSRTGEIKWFVNTLEEYNNRIPIWGLATSPIIEEGLVIVQIGGVPDACVVAFNMDSGKEVWRALEDEASYSTPIIIQQGDKKVMLIWTGESIAGLNPSTGEIYWKIPFEKKKMIMNVASPVWSSPYLFLTAFFDGSILLKLDHEKPSAEPLWHKAGKNERETIALHSTISTPIIKEGYVYGIGSYGELRCLDLLTAERIWEDKSLVRQGRWSNIHFVRQGEKVWGFNETGEMILGELTPAGFKNYGKVNLIDPVRISPNPRGGVCWAIPAFYGNRVIVRND